LFFKWIKQNLKIKAFLGTSGSEPFFPIQTCQLGPPFRKKGSDPVSSNEHFRSFVLFLSR
jgi:hypothetical protein